jgi:hypothetical protein
MITCDHVIEENPYKEICFLSRYPSSARTFTKCFGKNVIIMSQDQPTKLLKELEKLESLRQETSSHRRREDRRFVVRGDAKVVVLDYLSNEDVPSEVMLRDISRCGVSFLADRPIEVGAICRIRFIQQNYGVGETNVIIRCTREIEKHVHIIGCQICIKSGLMYLAGVDPPNIDGTNIDIDSTDSFVAPEDIK